MKRSSYGLIGLDIGAASIKAVQLRLDSGASVAHTVHLPRRTPGARLDREDAQRLAATLRRSGFIGNGVVANVPWGLLVSTVLDLPARGSGVPMDAIARQEMARACKIAPDQLEMGWWELTHSSAGARAQDGTPALGVGVRSGDAGELLDALDDAGLDVHALDAGPAAFSRLAPTNVDGGLVCVLDIGFAAARIAVVRSSVTVYERSLPEMGLSTLMSSLATHAGLDAESAELALRQVGCVARVGEPDAESWPEEGTIVSSVTAAADALASEARMSASYATRRFDGSTTSLMLTGGGALVPGLGQRVLERSGLGSVAVGGRLELDVSADLGLALGLALHSAALPGAWRARLAPAKARGRAA